MSPTLAQFHLNAAQANLMTDAPVTKVLELLELVIKLTLHNNESGVFESDEIKSVYNKVDDTLTIYTKTIDTEGTTLFIKEFQIIQGKVIHKWLPSVVI
jgi:hypothetical protein